MNRRLKQCPVCNATLEITGYRCNSCGTSIHGNFSISDFAALNPAQQEFVKVFICCGGNIKEVEKELKISYPTVKNKLAEVKAILCEATVASNKLSEDILDMIAAGKMSVQEALEKINKEK